MEKLKPHQVEGVSEFAVIEPRKTGGVNRFTVTGHDSEGPFKALRRYSEFEALRNHLRENWPGIFIPQVPSKKFVLIEDSKYVE